MKKVLIPIKSVIIAYNVLGTAKYSKLDNADKSKLLLIARALKKIVAEYDDFVADARKVMKPDIDNFDEKEMKWEETRAKIGAGIKDDLPMSLNDFMSFQYKVIIPYNKSVEDAIEKRYKDKIEIEFEPLSSDAFDKLATSNEWQVASALELIDLIVD